MGAYRLLYEVMDPVPALVAATVRVQDICGW